MSFIHSAELIEAGRDDRALRRQHEAGILTRIRPGWYVPTAEWAALSSRERHTVRVQATMHVVGGDLIISHDSAAALWGFPILDDWPRHVHLLDSRRRTAKCTSLVVVHPGRAVPGEAVGGLACTPAARTAADLVLARGFVQGLLGLDFGLAKGLFTLADVQAELAARASARGSVSARRAIGLADGRAGSALETISRAVVHTDGFRKPELQKRLVGANGRTYFVDFWWEQYGIIGEADGEEKYLDARMRGPRSFERVMLNEKERDDALRALPEVSNLVRWRYKTARQPGALAGLLVAAGLPRGTVC